MFSPYHKILKTNTSSYNLKAEKTEAIEILSLISILVDLVSSLDIFIIVSLAGTIRIIQKSKIVFMLCLCGKQGKGHRTKYQENWLISGCHLPNQLKGIINHLDSEFSHMKNRP